MAFDVEAARKAGYNDAEISAHLARRFSFDLKSARSSGYSDGEVIAHLASKAEIPGQQTPEAAAQQGIVDKLIGAGEAALTTATGAVGGTLGMIGGTLGGMAGSVATAADRAMRGVPQLPPQQSAQMVEDAAAAGAAGLTYAPRTEAGQEMAGAVGQVLQNLVPMAAVAPGMIPATAARSPAAPVSVLARAGVEGTARDAANMVARPAVAAGAVPAGAAGDAAAAGAAAAMNGAQRVGQMAKTATTLPRRAIEALRRTDETTPTLGAQGSVGAAGTDMAAIRRANAEALPVPIELTKGQATRDAAQLKFETEAAKIPDAGSPLRQRLIEQNDRVLQNFDVWIDQTGAQAPSLRAVGQAVDKALVEQAARDKTAIRVAYRNAEKAGEMEAPVALDTVVAHLNESMPDAGIAPIITAARNRALRYGVATEGAGGELVPQPVSLRVAERFRQNINDAVDYQPQNVRQATIIKGLIDEATDGTGGNLYRSARALRARYAQNYENHAVISKLVNLKRGTTDRQVAFEDVFQHSILKGSLDDVRQVRRVLQRGGDDGAQAWRELQGATASWLRDEAFKNVATDSAGNRVLSAAALDKAVRALDADGRLDHVFGKRGAQQMRDVRDMAQYIRTIPPESAVNTSNTAMTLLAGFIDVGSAGMTGVPVPLATSYRLVRQYVKDKALRRRIEDALDQHAKKQAPGAGRNWKRPVTAPGRTTH